jgi:hypothetical protein
MAERSVADHLPEEAANQIYRTFFDLFDAESYAHSLAAFVQLVLRT